MKLKRTQNNKANKETTIQDLTTLFFNLKDQHRNVFMEQIDDQVFIYRSLGRKEYKELINLDLDDMAKEEILCQTCVLWPEGYDFENCDAGIPTTLAKAILKNSFLDSENAWKIPLDHYRLEMWDLDNQITCIINEAFPQFDIEEIEEWDIEKTMKYLSRAEWKLHNLRGLEFVDPQNVSFYEKSEKTKPQVITRELTNKNEDESVNLKGGKKEKLTPEKLAELKAKFPEINWEQDSVAMEGISALNDYFDTTPVALRPGW